MKKPYTAPILIERGATQKLTDYLISNYGGNHGIVVCDENTFPYTLPFEAITAYRMVYENGVSATDIAAEEIVDTVSLMREPGREAKYILACGAGTIHDLCRFAAHKVKLPLISYPTAASMDGFVSPVAAMTIKGCKVTYPSTPPAALFADTDVFSAAPPSLTAAGVGDIVGKYTSLFDWQLGVLLCGEIFDRQIYELEKNAVDKVMSLTFQAGDSYYTERVMECLVLSGLAIQYMGNSRPASAAEHHLSHLWEMHCINESTPALHGEKVGVATQLILRAYQAFNPYECGNTYAGLDFGHEYLDRVFGTLKDGILSENKNPCDSTITAEKIKSCAGEIKALLEKLPSPESIRDYLRRCNAKTTLSDIGLPDTEEFLQQSLCTAPYVRNRLTLLRIMKGLK